ncbi:hypothetical protein AB1Y20_014516 [Prymnesium parvum]|uniref:SAP domain-containing protein n=1 Tax=Prymnesium parvum TaxID=97485 RepID=A0AB34IC83_PRYPA
MSLAWAALGKALPCRALVLDWRALTLAHGESAWPDGHSARGAAAAGLSTRHTPLRHTAAVVGAGRADALLLHELREELARRGASTVGGRRELVERLQPLLDAPPLLAAGVREKYAARVAAKLAHSLPRQGAAEEERRGARWNVQPGLRELLQYVEMRGMARLLLPAEGLPPAEARRGAEELAAALKLSPFCGVVPAELAEAVRGGEGAAVERLAGSLELEPWRLLLVSDHRATVGAAREARACSCYFAKNVEGAAARIPADFVIKTIAGVKDAIEELNGVTFRSPDTEIKTKYGVNCT